MKDFNIYWIEKEINDIKSGLLKESATDSHLVISKFFYGGESIMAVSGSNTIDGKSKVFINESLLDEFDYDIKDIVNKEISSLKKKKSIKSNRELKESTNINDYIDGISFIAYQYGIDSSSKMLYHMMNEGYDLFDYASKQDVKRYTALLKEAIVNSVKQSKRSISLPNNILKEGMIKVPNKAMDYTSTFVEYFIYHKILDRVENHRTDMVFRDFNIDDDLMSYITNSVREAGVYIDDSGMHGEIDVSLKSSDIPYETNDGLDIRFIFQSNSTDASGEVTLGNTPTIYINFHDINQRLDQIDFRNYDKYDRSSIMQLKKDIINTVRHELMHVMQYFVFAKKDFDSNVLSNSPMKDDDTWSDYEKYVLSSAEFDPAIHDVVEDFKSQINAITELTGDIDTKTQKELLKKFLGTHYKDGEVYWQGNHQVSVAIEQAFRPPSFIRAIRSKMPELWPKVAKKITQELF